MFLFNKRVVELIHILLGTSFLCTIPTTIELQKDLSIDEENNSNINTPTIVEKVFKFQIQFTGCVKNID